MTYHSVSYYTYKRIKFASETEKDTCVVHHQKPVYVFFPESEVRKAESAEIIRILERNVVGKFY